MRITKISSNPSFKSLKINIDENLLKNIQIKNKLTQIQNIFKENGFNRKKNVNVILNYDTFQNKFVGLIESKKQGVPYNPDNKKIISNRKKDIENFRKWLNNWDYLYSKKVLNKNEKLQKKVLKIFSKNDNV